MWKISKNGNWKDGRIGEEESVKDEIPKKIKDTKEGIRDGHR